MVLGGAVREREQLLEVVGELPSGGHGEFTTFSIVPIDAAHGPEGVQGRQEAWALRDAPRSWS